MSLRRLLEEFPETNTAHATTEDSAQQALEEAKTRGFEQGYKSGWEDAIAEERKRHGQLNAEFERCIRDLGFGHHEAIDLVRSELAQFLGDMIDALFPELVPDLLRETVRSEILELAEEHLNPSIRILASENVSSQLQVMMPETSLDVVVEVEPSLGDYQAHISLSNRERAIDFKPLIDLIREQLAAIGNFTTHEADDDE